MSECKNCGFGTPELKDGLCRNCLRAFRKGKINILKYYRKNVNINYIFRENKIGVD